MSKFKNFINKLTKNQKIICLIVISFFVLCLSVGVPTLARLKNRVSLVSAIEWTGNVATSYESGSGLETDPYIITSGEQLAFFNEQLDSDNYSNKYFKLNNDILLNKGNFEYNESDGLTYTLDGTKYYVKENSNEYYETKERTGEVKGKVNLFDSLDNFKGNFDGNSFTIYGLYISDNSKEELGLFTNMQGNISNLYVNNSMIYGGLITGGIASSTANGKISNTSFDGYVISRKSLEDKTIDNALTAQTINATQTMATKTLTIVNNTSLTGSNIKSSKITGNLEVTGDNTVVKINDQIINNGNFEIDLGTTELYSLRVSTVTDDADGAIVTLSNLNYSLTYERSIAGGIIGLANNATIVNSLNKGNITSYSSCGGLVGTSTNLLNISNSYNLGNVTSTNVAGGLVGVSEKASNLSTINKTYNAGLTTGNTTGGLFGIINKNYASITISNSFNDVSEYTIGRITNGSTVNVNNVYYTNKTMLEGSANGSFKVATSEELKTGSFLNTNLTFNEFVSEDNLSTNTNNLWVFENDSYPIIYLDDSINPVANIHLSTYTWNNYSNHLDTVNITNNVAFQVESVNELKPIKEASYFISESKTPLTKDELKTKEWTKYSNIVSISKDGYYVVYIKVLDYSGNESYINTDLLKIDLSAPTGNIAINGANFSNYREEPGYLYLDRSKSFTITASDNMSDIKSNKYYISNELLTIKNLEDLNENNWLDYTKAVDIKDIGTYIVYAKITDGSGYTTYINSDYIVLDGYKLDTYEVGRTNGSVVNTPLYITDKSSVTIKYKYEGNIKAVNNNIHTVTSNKLLPTGTKITVIDYDTNKSYSYLVPSDEDIYGYGKSCDSENASCIRKATYPLTLFSEDGKRNVNTAFDENTYVIREDAKENIGVVVDFKDTNITNNITNIIVGYELQDQNNSIIRPSLYSSLKPFSVYIKDDNNASSHASLSVTSNYSGSGIIYRTDSDNKIMLSTNITYKKIDSVKIYDTTYDDKFIGFSISLIDSNSKIVDRKYLENSIYKIGNTEASFDDDNIIRASANSLVTNTSSILNIINAENKLGLKEGTYNYKISLIVSDDGKYYSELTNSRVNIPLIVTESYSKVKHSFDVKMPYEDRIIRKTDLAKKVTFNVIEKGDLTNPNVRVSLYKKDELTAFNQNYSLVDLKDYMSSSLQSYSDKIYYAFKNPVSYLGTSSTYNKLALDLNMDKFESTGYKFVFELYDDNIKIDQVEKYIVVK